MIFQLLYKFVCVPLFAVVFLFCFFFYANGYPNITARVCTYSPQLSMPLGFWFPPQRNNFPFVSVLRVLWSRPEIDNIDLCKSISLIVSQIKWPQNVVLESLFTLAFPFVETTTNPSHKIDFYLFLWANVMRWAHKRSTLIIIIIKIVFFALHNRPINNHIALSHRIIDGFQLTIITMLGIITSMATISSFKMLRTPNCFHSCHCKIAWSSHCVAIRAHKISFHIYSAICDTKPQRARCV